MSLSSQVFCRFQVEGLHYWLEAPQDYGYLAHPHRHIFHVTVTVDVHHGREVEFIDLKHRAEEAFKSIGIPSGFGMLTFGPRSCEDLAEQLLSLLLPHYDVAHVIVSEDGENGALFSRKNHHA